jgi:hypothetical protein
MARLPTAAFLILALLCADVGFAQERRRPRQPEGAAEGTQIPPELAIADLKFGPFYLQPRATFKDLGWDNNITGQREGAGKSADFRATPGGGLKIALPFRQNHMITGDGQIDYLWYRENPQLRTFNGAAVAQYAYTSDMFEVDLLNRYVDAQQTQTGLIQIGDGTVEPEFEIFEAARQRTNLAQFTGTWHLNPFHLEGRTSRRVVRIKELDPEATSLAESLDRTEETVGGTVGFQVTPKSRLAFVVDWTNYDYETAGNIREAETYRAGAKIDLDPTAPLNGSVLVGYRDLAPRRSEALGFEGVVVDGEIGVQPGGVLAITLAGTRDAFPSFFGSNIYYIRQGGGISILAQAVRELAVGADVSLHEHRYPVEASATQDDGSTLTAERLDRVYQFTGRLQWSQSAWTAIGIRIGWVNRTSNFDFANIDGLVVATSYSLTY